MNEAEEIMRDVAKRAGPIILHELMDLSTQRYGEGATRAYLRTLLMQAEIQGLHGLRAVELLSDELKTLKQVMEVTQ